MTRWKTQKTHLIKCAMDASYGDMASESAGNICCLSLVDFLSFQIIVLASSE